MEIEDTYVGLYILQFSIFGIAAMFSPPKGVKGHISVWLGVLMVIPGLGIIIGLITYLRFVFR